MHTSSEIFIYSHILIPLNSDKLWLSLTLDFMMLICLYTAPHRKSASLLVTRYGLMDGGVPYFSTIFCCVSFFQINVEPCQLIQV